MFADPSFEAELITVGRQKQLDGHRIEARAMVKGLDLILGVNFPSGPSWP
jgi:hypothetical protein